VEAGDENSKKLVEELEALAPEVPEPGAIVPEAIAIEPEVPKADVLEPASEATRQA
jgi:hypothetical protein